MSEQQQIKIGTEWRNVFGITPPDASGRIGVLYESKDTWDIGQLRKSDLADRLRPAPVAEVEAEGQRKFVPTPHEPVEGVRLTNGVHFASCYGYGAYVSVDGKEPMHYLQASGIIDEACCFDPDTHRHPILHKGLAGYIAALTAFRDRIRQERNAKAEPKDATPHPFTSEEEAAIEAVAERVARRIFANGPL